MIEGTAIIGLATYIFGTTIFKLYPGLLLEELLRLL